MTKYNFKPQTRNFWQDNDGFVGKAYLFFYCIVWNANATSTEWHNQTQPNFILQPKQTKLWRLIVIVWRSHEHISAPSSKTVGNREKVFWGNM